MRVIVHLGTERGEIVGITSGYGPRNRSPLKWIIWSGSSAIQTSDSRATCEAKVCMVRRVSKAVTKTRPALQPAKRSLSSLRRLAEVAFEDEAFSLAGRGIVRIVSAQPPVSPVEVWAAHCFSTG